MAGSNWDELEDDEKAFIETSALGQLEDILKHDLGHGSYALVSSKDTILQKKLIARKWWKVLTRRAQMKQFCASLYSLLNRAGLKKWPVSTISFLIELFE